ncbi:50S ribosomal protein L30 [Desulfococcaceae bacterium OttesenSCG-928-F15]|nr:50S ribosomal protein L30 [Desulfococcaceae bacterium OttesenSCG-928-F15]
MGKLRIELVRSMASEPEKHRKTLRALKLTKINKSVVLEANDAVLGMVNKVHHLVKVEEV